MPGPDWMAIHSPQEKWTSAYTANVSIGQGYVLATPLQMAMAYATVANGGISYYPRLVEKVLNQDGKPALDENGKVAVPETPKIHADLRNEFTPEQIELVRHGLWEVVNDDGGTGRVARMQDVEVAGKTGTAQVKAIGKEENVAWFCCFAPYDHPEVRHRRDGARCLGTRRHVAGPIADRILERTLAMDAGKL